MRMKTNPRLLHLMLRVANLQKSIDFYCDVLGMSVLRKKEYPSGKFTLVFLGYGKESEVTVLELTYNWEQHDYDIGTGYGHIAIGVNDIYQTCEEIRSKGGQITREPGPMKHGTSLLAFVKDPDGYSIELLERA
ncbi:MAG: lactoylglutathione lyase [bacterium]